MNSRVTYDISNADELFEYLWLKSPVTGINADLFVDDGGAYKRHKHPLLLFVRNGQGREVSDFLSIIVYDKPEIISSQTKINLSEEILSQIYSFITANVKVLELFADSKLLHDEFIETLVESKATK